ncbi:MAG TPA: glycosyltransferase [Acidimicrobiales bacterium]|nr:glycosyltransferase [Acidimicrobiales bacterium]
MRVLVVHNEYSSRLPSGENLSVRDEVAWLRSAGVDVHTHLVSNDTIAEGTRLTKVRQAAQVPWSRSAGARLRADIERLRPDVVHVHNLFPLLTASAPWSALRAGVPVVWSCRNRRVVCVEGTHFRNGLPCHLCRPGWRLPGVRYGCYQRLAVGRGEISAPAAAAASALVTVSSGAFRAIARRQVLAIGIAENVRDWLVDVAHFPAERVRVKFNGVAGPPPGVALPPPETNDEFLFAGQLADYKGLPLLIEAWRRSTSSGARLRIVGGGTEAAQVEAAAASDPRLTYVGTVAPAAIAGEMKRARAVIVPSTAPETFGRVAAEALAHGRPVITSGLGGLGEIVDSSCGWVTGTDPAALAAAIDEAAIDDTLVARRGAAGRRRHARRFSPEATTAALLEIYGEAIELRAGGAGLG